MPYRVARSAKCPPSKPWACIKISDGKVMGCHATQQSARAQQAALYANEAVHNHQEELLRKYSEDEPRVPAGSGDESGEWTSGGGGGSNKPGGGGRKPDKGKVARATATYKPSTKAKQALADKAEAKVATMVGGERTDDNFTVDVLVDVGKVLVGIEVKSVQDNGNNKITMHKKALARKQAWADKPGRRIYTVVVDSRYGRIYYRQGVGSFRIGTLTRVRSAADLRAKIGLKKSYVCLEDSESLLAATADPTAAPFPEGVVQGGEEMTQTEEMI